MNDKRSLLIICVTIIICICIVCGTFIMLNMNGSNSKENDTVNITMDNATNNTTNNTTASTQSNQATTSSSGDKSVAKASTSGSNDPDAVSSPSTPSSKLDSKDYYTTGVDYYKGSDGNYYYTQYSNGKVVDSGKAHKTSTGQVAKS